MHALARAGADVIELGVPFSDPMADGPVIQKATERAIGNGIGLRAGAGVRARSSGSRCGHAGRADGLRQPDRTHTAAHEHSPTAARAAGVDGVLVVDYPPEECEEFAAEMRAAGIDPIFLLAPTSTDDAHRRGRATCQRLRLLRQR